MKVVGMVSKEKATFGDNLEKIPLPRGVRLVPGFMNEIYPCPPLPQCSGAMTKLHNRPQRARLRVQGERQPTQHVYVRAEG